MFFSEIASLTAKELNKKKKELQSQMFEARMKNTLGQLANQMVIRDARRDIARINTALTTALTAQRVKSSAGTVGTATKAKKPASKTATRAKKG